MTDDTWRLFIALELPHELLAVLANIQADLKRRAAPGTVRWVRPEGIHLTLKFLGDVPLSRHATLTDALHAAAQECAPLTLTSGGLGCFPNSQRPRVMWVGIEGDRAPLNALQRAIETHLTAAGFAPEDRPFSPHLTLGRVQRSATRSAVQQLGALIQDAQRPTAVTWDAAAVSLMRSELAREGARYTCLAQAPLGPATEKTDHDEAR